MTKKELIEEIKDLPDDAKIYILDQEQGYGIEIEDVLFVDIWTGRFGGRSLNKQIYHDKKGILLHY